MKNEKIALLVDSACDVPKNILDRDNVYLMPLKVVRDGETFIDGVTIFADEVANTIANHDFKTSLPSGGEIEIILQQIVDDGFNKIIIVTISSGLSGTNNIARLIATEFSEKNDIEISIIDTLSIGMGSGLMAIYCADLINESLPYSNIIEIINNSQKRLSIYFCVATLEYLQKGGRIGKVAALVGGLLDLKPIITCNEQGTYYPIAKVRSRKQSLLKAAEYAIKDSHKYKKVNVALVYTENSADVEIIREKLKTSISNINNFYEGQISPVLVVHTGPGLVGIGIYGIE